MPAKPKAQTSKKNDQKKKEKLIEDKTFGLKNKNKSKKVQAQITSVHRNITNSGDPRQRKLDEQRKMAKAASKARKTELKKEQDNLFSEALLAVQGKTKNAASKSNVEAKGRDAAEAENKSSGTSGAMKLMYQMDAKEAVAKLKEDPFYVATLEDELEEKRQAKLEELEKSGKKGTPITEETFKVWLANKKQKRAVEARKAVEAEFKKKKGGKGLSVLSGRDLYLYNESLFKDFDDEVEDVNTNTDDADHKAAPSSKEAVVVNEKLNENLFLQEEDDDLDDISDDE